MMKTLLFLIVLSTLTLSQIKFEDYFLDKTLRVDYQRAGDKTHTTVFFDEMIEEPNWGGPKKNLIEDFNYGKYRAEVKDAKTGKVIFARNYSTLYSEWQTTEEAKKIKKSFPESVVIPFPKDKVLLTLYSRDKRLKLHEEVTWEIDPKNYFIKKDRRHVYNSFKVINNGDSHNKVDIVIIPDGYTKEEMDLFKSDCNKFAQYLFNSSPYKEQKEKFNIWGVEAPSVESGTDIPGSGIWKQTVLNSGFFTFDVDRYCMTQDYKSVRDVAANAPYDQIYILVNSPKYGGGAIYNYYSLCVNNNSFEEYIFVHEFGHGFASLADEYFDSETAYQDFYAYDVEPADPNLTTLVNFDEKWKDMVGKNVPIPTPNTDEYKNAVGAFEGGGYVKKGIYRPMMDCTMKSITVDNFCPVCKKAITDMINFYTE